MGKFNNFLIGLISIGIGGLIVFFYMSYKNTDENGGNTKNPIEQIFQTNNDDNETSLSGKDKMVSSNKNVQASTQPIDLRYAAQQAVKGVVHVKTIHTEQTYATNNPFLEFFYGYSSRKPTRKILQAGSGVIISPDGYIITNNHVIKNSEKISVTLSDNRSFLAQLVGSDENTDLALLKVDNVNNLDTIPFANSDDVALGEWVLAVGNPFDLTSTVTSGIVSAKARSIKKDNQSHKLSLDAFIQTDAAVNSGNSGGALVNSAGRLIGINTAIESSTGAYIGYSFAIPSNIARKVTEDLKQFGKVQRAFLGIQISTVTNTLAEQFHLKEIEGVFVYKVFENSASEKAGLQKGDVIVSINNRTTNNVEQLQEQIGKYSPNDTVNIKIKRQGIEKEFELQLQGVTQTTEKIAFLGADFKTLSTDDFQQLPFSINSGVQVVNLYEGRLSNAGMSSHFIIQRINNVAIQNIEDIKIVLQQNVLRGRFWIEGIYPNGRKQSFQIS